MQRLPMVLAGAAVAALAALHPGAGNATPCVDGATLASYLGTTCTIGDKTFSNFNYTGSGSGGALAIPADGITVRTVGPSGSGAGISFPDIGFQFSAPWTVGSGQGLDSLIQFDLAVTSGPQLIKDAGLVQSGTGFIAPGIASIAENLSNNLGGFVSQLLTVDSANAVVLAANELFSPVGWLHVDKDLSVLGNLGGIGTISDMRDTFSQTSVLVPEPASLALLGTALLCFGLLRRRRGAA